MPQGLSRFWPALVLTLFGLPLFIGVRNTDLRNDEPIYSFAVDRMLETGDWLTPRSIPHEDAAFLEKPPLKFWIIAAPIRLGILPLDEFGLRFWDALFGAVAFLYVWAIGRRLAGPICGAAAGLILFVHVPLLFDHGIRSNNMEAALLLSHCGGVYHFLAWGSSDRLGQRRRHAAAVAGYFVLGFMTKFVAALFLPLMLGAAGLVVGQYRTRLVREWRLWLAASGLALALIVPWFLYAHLKFGALFWDILFSQHVYTRFTTSLNPDHVQPWYYYLTRAYESFRMSRTLELVGAGLLLLLARTAYERRAEGVVVLLWFVLPTAIISTGTSKLYHYFYPYLPPLALAAGYLISSMASIAPACERSVRALARRVVADGPPRVAAILQRRSVRSVLFGLAIAALAIATVTVLYGPIRLTVRHTVLFKSSGLLRPLGLAVLLSILAGRPGLVTRLGVPLVILWLLPLSAYRDMWSRIRISDHPVRSTRDCVRRVQMQAHAESPPPGVYVDGPDALLYSAVYYFRTVGPWQLAQTPSDQTLADYLYNPAEQRPVLISEARYRTFMRENRARGGVERVAMGPYLDTLVLLPGPYAICGAETMGR